METTAAILNPSDTFFAALMLQTMNPAGCEQVTSFAASETILEAAKTPLDEEDEDEDDDEDSAEDDDEEDDLEDDDDLEDEDDEDDLEDDEDDDDEEEDDEVEDDDDPKPLRVKSRL